MKFTLSHKVLLVVAVPVVFQLGYLAFLTDSLNQLAESQAVEQAKTQILVLRDRVYTDLSQRGVLISLYRATQNPLYQSRSDQFNADARDAFALLSNLFDAQKKHIVDRWWHGDQIGIKLFEEATADVRPETFADLFGDSLHARIVKRQFDHHSENPLERLFEEERIGQLDAEHRMDQLRKRLQNTLLFGLAASLFLGLAAGLFFSSSISSRLRTVLLNIKSMEDGSFNLKIAGGSDEIGKLDKAVRETAKEIQNAEQFQARTVEIVADELERPLATLSTDFAALKLRGFETLIEKGSLRLERTDLEIGRLRRLVNELGLINTLRTASLDLQIREIDLADAARRAVEIVNDLARSKKVRLCCNPTSIKVFADENRLLQVVVNLLSNAIKFSPADSVVSIETSLRDSCGRLSVADQGPGISDAFKSKIFTNFEQAHSSDAREKKGTGLGLAISKNIIEQHHGQMGFETELGAGTTFWLTLPTTAVTEIAPPLGTVVAATETKSHSWQPTLWKKGVMIIALPLLVNLITLGTLSMVLNSLNDNIIGYTRAHQIASLHSSIVDDLASSFAYAMLFNVLQDESCRKSAMLRREAITNALAQLEPLVSKEEVPESEQMRKTLEENFKVQDEIMNAPQDGKIDRWFGQKGAATIENVMLSTQKPFQAVIQHEQESMDARTLASQETRNLLNLVLLSSAVLGGAVSAGLALFMARRLSNRISVVAENVVRLAHRTLPNHPLQGNDELAFVDKAIYEAANKLMELEQVRQEMVAVSSHELRTPLTSLSVLTELIEAGSFGALTEDGIRLVQKAKETSDDLISMITNLLDLEKMQSGKMLVHKELCQMDDILRTATSHLIPLSEKCHVELRTEHSDTAAELDQNRIVQALTSILREFVDDLPAKSTVSLSCPRDKHGVAIKISAPNARTDASATTRESHAARQRLAIDLTKSIVEQHGGQMHIRSSQDTRVVTITLPTSSRVAQ